MFFTHMTKRIFHQDDLQQRMRLAFEHFRSFHRRSNLDLWTCILIQIRQERFVVANLDRFATNKSEDTWFRKKQLKNNELIYLEVW